MIDFNTFELQIIGEFHKCLKISFSNKNKNNFRKTPVGEKEKKIKKNPRGIHS